MNDDHDAVLIPMPLRDFLAELRETKRAAVAQGFRLTVTNARESLDTITRRFVTESPHIPLIRDDVIMTNEFFRAHSNRTAYRTR